jgi:hypothetical protein
MAYMKSEKAIKAADRPTAGPLSAEMRIFGWCEKVCVMSRLWAMKDFRMSRRTEESRVVALD